MSEELSEYCSNENLVLHHYDGEVVLRKITNSNFFSFKIQLQIFIATWLLLCYRKVMKNDV
jgi:hypothetical protein